MKLFAIRCSLIFSLALFCYGQGVFAQSVVPPTAVSMVDEDDIVPDTKEGITHEYHCDMKDVLTIYTNADDNEHIALRWKNHIYRLKRIATTTGANRFENKKAGLVWIGIPTKGMLLDSKHGQQLANECKTTS